MNTWMFLDPSLKTIGWCVAELTRTKTRVIEASRIFSHGKAARLKNDAKIDLMVAELELKLNCHRPSHIVIEIPSGKVNEARHRGRGSGLSVYGFAVGHVRECCRQWVRSFGGELISIMETEWTGGHGKDKRRLVAGRVWPELEKISDPGADIADAIALAEWWRAFKLCEIETLSWEEEDTFCCFICRIEGLGAFVEVPWCDEKVKVCKEHLKPEKPKQRRKKEHG